MDSSGFRPNVYPILDAGGVVSASESLSFLDALLEAGVSVVQLRAKTLSDREFCDLARACRERTRKSGTQLIIDDRADIAQIVGADGVHLGQHDLPARVVRRWLPKTMLIGVSCHDEAQTKAATEAGDADYLGFGPIYETSSKANPDPTVGLELLEVAVAATHLPVVAIGGITVERIPEVLAAGATSVAMISDLLQAADVCARTRAAIEASQP